MILRLAINSDSFLIPRFWFVVMRDLIQLQTGKKCTLPSKFKVFFERLHRFHQITCEKVKKITGAIAFQRDDCKIVKKPEEFT